MDENEAKRKAIFKGVENFEIDHDLFGRNASFFHKKNFFQKYLPTNLISSSSGSFKANRLKIAPISIICFGSSTKVKTFTQKPVFLKTDLLNLKDNFFTANTQKK